MPDDMPSSWRYINSPSSRFLTVKGYIKRYTVNDNQTQSWREWAGQKIKLRRGQTEEEAFVREKLTLFPGWATRRYDHSTGSHDGMS